jgi:hypothetical protein
VPPEVQEDLMPTPRPGTDTATGTDPEAKWERPGYEDKSLGQAVDQDREFVDALLAETGDLDEAERRFREESAGAPALARQQPHPEPAAAPAAMREALAQAGRACRACSREALSAGLHSELQRCIELTLVCAEVCAAAGRAADLLEADEPTLASVISACAAACRRCAEECEVHADAHDHCRACAVACRRCEAECHALLDDLGDRSASPSPAVVDG